MLLVYGTIGVSAFTMTVAMSLAEMSDAYPTSRGLHHLFLLESPLLSANQAFLVIGQYHVS